ncbi:glycosyltransferase family 2 protein [Novosphingobium olei]|uniref:Uncharacterized protein n=1 Tax=Novosphingobium olei TaxID=2728851 RepID=A0A7Y0BSC8_9SPHN|nr:hypothetical protein [Novosphingobium olei]NML95689.1 hypothetical protein [Novosphingobium olei]
MSSSSSERRLIPLILLTTADMQAQRDDELRRLVGSIEAFRKRFPEVQVHHHMLLQRCDDLKGAVARVGFPSTMEVSSIGDLVPLSVARNQMLRLIAPRQDLLTDDCVLAYPDDDAWYPSGSLDWIYTRFVNDQTLDFWFCRYGTLAECPAKPSEVRPSLHEVISKASSNTIALRGRIVKKIGGFDESLGLGTPAKSGEDTDYAMRAYFASKVVRYAPHRMVGHRDFDPSIRAKYYGGTLAALGRHRRHSFPATLAFLRKIAVGLALLFKGELSPSLFKEAWSQFSYNKPKVIRAAN